MTRAPRPPAASVARTTRRLPQLDMLKAVLVAWIIGGHALLGYAAIGGWEYSEIREATFEPGVEFVLTAMLGPSALVVIGTFFFVAGLFVPQALAKHGHRQFVRDRVIRLGVPYLAFVLLLWPLLLWLSYRAAGRPASLGWFFAGREPLLDAGPLWFVAVLLLFSVGYAWLVRAGWSGPAVARLRGRHLVALAVAVTVSTFAVRLWLPARGTQAGDLHVWEWPQCAAMFGLGLAGSFCGLAEHVPDRLRRASGATVLGTVVLLPVLALLAGVGELSRDVEPFLGGWSWPALATAAVEGTLVVAGSVWLLGTAQRRFTARGRLSAEFSRASYAAFVLQGPVLLGLALAIRPVPVPVEAKAFVVAAAAIAVAFWLGWLLVSRTPLRRIL